MPAGVPLEAERIGADGASRPDAFALALCADDYGMTPAVSRGIREAIEAGALTATSAMTTFPDCRESAALLAPLANRVDVGLHLNLTLGAPLGSMPVLAPAGRLPDVGALMRLSLGKRLPVAEIAAELDRQLDAFVGAFGRPPDHVDGHQHVHVLRPIRSLVLAALRRRGWRPWIRDPGDALDRILRRKINLKKAIGLAVLSRGMAADVVAEGMAVNQGFAGFSAFDPATSYEALFERYLVAPGSRHLVMCHPGYIDEPLRRLDPVVDTREQELAFLTSRRFGESLARAGAELVRLSSRRPPGQAVRA